MPRGIFDGPGSVSYYILIEKFGHFILFHGKKIIVKNRKFQDQ
jgi:hypothetical protein